MTKIFAACKNLLLWAIMCVFFIVVLVYHLLSTVNCKSVAIPDCLIPCHDCHLDVQWNTIAAWATIHSGFPVTLNQWKREYLNSERKPRTPWVFESGNSGNVSYKPWPEVFRGCVLMYYITFPNPFRTFWIYCSMFLHMSMFDILTTNGVSH